MRKNLTHNRPKPKKSRSKKIKPSGASFARKMKVRKGDTVVIVSGKDKGKQGAVLEVFPKTGRIVVDGVAVAKRSLRASGRGQSGRIVERPMPIDASNAMVLDPETKTGSRVGRAKRDGKTVRVSKKSKTILK